MGVWYEIYRWGNEITHQNLGSFKCYLAGLGKKFTTIESHAGMAEQLVRDLAIEDTHKM